MRICRGYNLRTRATPQPIISASQTPGTIQPHGNCRNHERSRYARACSATRAGVAAACSAACSCPHSLSSGSSSHTIFRHAGGCQRKRQRRGIACEKRARRSRCRE